ncbi:MAG TPA: redoxin domain-containing protein [Planctomycetaceae bacterium]|nr:redoxin domain-containing protein [Planctomycetaceae bacterium]
MIRLCSIAIWSFVLLVLPTAQAGESSMLGRKIDGFKLHDFRGAAHELDDWADRGLLVVAFVGAECPLAKLYAPRLAELAAEYGPRGVGFVAINANQQDSLAELAHYARVHRIEFPLLKDPGNAVADQFGAERTPEVFVLDRERVVRYRGRIDDQYGVGYSRAAPTRRDLAVALDELLARKTVSTPQTAAVGCHIGRVRKQAATGDVTYSKHVAPILQKHCVRCHRDGEIAPFTLTSFADTAGWTETIREVVEQQRMPPWHASPRHGEFANSRRLPDAEKELLLTWIENGAPAGDPADLPEPVEFPEGWTIPQPDLVVQMPAAFAVPARGTVEYQYVKLDHTFDEDTWVVAGEARPGNRAVVHHLVLFFVRPDEPRRITEAALFNALAVFAPGMPAWEAPEGLAKRIPAGSKLYMQLHYTPNGSPQTDQSRAGLVFADPRRIVKEMTADVALNHEFLIPPGAADHRVEAAYRFRQDMRLVSLFPHMHLRGKSFRYEAEYPDGRREILLDVPRYDFNWQNYYLLAEPRPMPEGTLLRCTAAFDNSEANLANPDPGRAVHWGDQTWDEMMVGQFEAALEHQDLRLGRPRVTPLDGGEFDVEFRFQPDAPAGKVCLAGTFNDWKPDGHALSGPDTSGTYSTTLRLKPGRHEYKFVIDGTIWRADPGNPDQTGFYNNSLLQIRD